MLEILNVLQPLLIIALIVHGLIICINGECECEEINFIFCIIAGLLIVVLFLKFAII